MATKRNLRHELRTPLNHIIGYSEMLIEDVGDDDVNGLCSGLQTLHARGKDLLDLVNRLSVAEDGSAIAFGDWQPLLTEVFATLDRLRPVFEVQVPDCLNDLVKIHEAATRLTGLFEGGGGTVALNTERPGEMEVYRHQPMPHELALGRLLVVDDDPSNCDLLRRRLEQRGYEVAVTRDGEAALALIEREDFDVVLLDVLMPDVSGIDVLQRVRRYRAFQDLPIIMVTAKHGSENIVESLHLGANDYITKPIDFPVALARISTQIYLRQVTRKLAEANERLYRYSYIDALTGIANRRNFDEYISREWARGMRERQPISIILIDVDFFKFYNDNYGHDEGDKILVRIAQVLSATLYRGTDLMARYGGEEFIAVLPMSGPNVAVAVAERLRNAVSTLGIPHGYHKSEDHITVSLGIAGIIPNESVSMDELRIAADQALYVAKRRGRNRSVCYGDLATDCSVEQCVAAPNACGSRP